jgi:hypothetical protein
MRQSTAPEILAQIEELLMTTMLSQDAIATRVGVSQFVVSKVNRNLPTPRGYAKKPNRAVAKPKQTPLNHCTVDWAREINGLRPIVAKKRMCLQCEREFSSQSAGNRICGYCKERTDRWLPR